ncbi:MAG: Maf family nucleotide pyrophosphatase [Prevotellaceae bacterium]|jgi:septum formation protein|nr:Maf family nucleotide pyrophosphatase [Prevotellaceae bacterium]
MLHEQLSSYKLILASQSPRRQELMRGLGMAFAVAPHYHVDETFPAAMPKDEVPVFLARLKSEQYPHSLDERDILITADTLVWCRNEFLGKPKDEADARRMLRLMSGSVHEVLTGVCLRSSCKTETFLSSTQVYFRPLDEGEISRYLSTCRPYDKAGAYGIQEWIGYVAIERIEGSYYNVMGLPTQRLYVELAKFIAPA